MPHYLERLKQSQLSTLSLKLQSWSWITSTVQQIASSRTSFCHNDKEFRLCSTIILTRAHVLAFSIMISMTCQFWLDLYRDPLSLEMSGILYQETTPYFNAKLMKFTTTTLVLSVKRELTIFPMTIEFQGHLHFIGMVHQMKLDLIPMGILVQ